MSLPSPSPRQMLIVESHRMNPPYSFPTFLDSTVDIGNQIQIVSPDKIRLLLRMNPTLTEDSDGKKNLARIAAAADADTVLVFDREEGKRAFHVAYREELYEVDTSSYDGAPLKGAEIATWTAHALGHNGYVVDVKQNHILIRSSSPILNKSRQGLVLRRDTQLPAISAKSNAILGIIEKRSTKEGFGIFQILVPQVIDTIHPGDLVLLSN